MKVNFGINKKSLDSILKKVDRLGGSELLKEIQQANTKSSWYLVKAARNNLKLNGTDDTGGLRSSIQILDTKGRGLIFETGTELSYSGAIEYGTTGHEPNFRDLMEWTNRKVNPATDRLWITTKWIANKIEAKGTEAQPFLAPAATETKKKHAENVANAINNLTKKISK